MSSVERQSCPLHWGHDPTPTKPEEQDHLSPLLTLGATSVHLCASQMRMCNRSHRHSVYTIGPREREEAGVESPDEPLSWSARNENLG